MMEKIAGTMYKVATDPKNPNCVRAAQCLMERRGGEAWRKQPERLEHAGSDGGAVKQEVTIVRLPRPPPPQYGPEKSSGMGGSAFQHRLPRTAFFRWPAAPPPHGAVAAWGVSWSSLSLSPRSGIRAVGTRTRR
jgi:hypothetical protein